MLRAGIFDRYATAERCEDNEALWLEALIEHVVVAMDGQVTFACFGGRIRFAVSKVAQGLEGT